MGVWLINFKGGTWEKTKKQKKNKKNRVRGFGGDYNLEHMQLSEVETEDHHREDDVVTTYCIWGWLSAV